MTRRSLLSLGAAAMVCGVLAAAVLALTLPRSSAAPAAGDPAHPTVAPPRPLSSIDREGRAHKRIFGTATIEARTRDPLGGPDWAVRVARQQYFARDRHGRMRPMSHPERCAQLGRVLDGRFGWVDGANVFRPLPLGISGAPRLCGSATADLARKPQLGVVARIAHPASNEARLLQSVAWGFVGSTGTADLDVDGGAAAISSSPHGVFVRPIALTRGRPDVGLTVRYPRGNPIAVSSSFRGDAEHLRELFGNLVDRLPGRRAPSGFGGQPLPRAGIRPVLDDRVLDPSGGLSWGHAVVPSEGRGWCTSALGRVVGQRVGSIDADLGTFTDAGPDMNLGCRRADSLPTRARPLTFMYSFTSMDDGVPGGPPSANRIARRTQPGRMTIDGIALPAVRSITISTPRDVRTITPSPRAHAFAVVYDGDFPTGRIQLMAELADGSTYRVAPFNGSSP